MSHHRKKPVVVQPQCMTLHEDQQIQPLWHNTPTIHFHFFYLGFSVAFNAVQVISWRVVGRAEENTTYCSSGFCTVNWQPTANNYQLSHLRLCQEQNPGLRGGRRESYHSAILAPIHFQHCKYECNVPAFLSQPAGQDHEDYAHIFSWAQKGQN